jgi:hypothetical protein
LEVTPFPPRPQISMLVCVRHPETENRAGQATATLTFGGTGGEGMTSNFKVRLPSKRSSILCFFLRHSGVEPYLLMFSWRLAQARQESGSCSMLSLGCVRFSRGSGTSRSLVFGSRCVWRRGHPPSWSFQVFRVDWGLACDACMPSLVLD